KNSIDSVGQPIQVCIGLDEPSHSIRAGREVRTTWRRRSINGEDAVIQTRSTLQIHRNCTGHMRSSLGRSRSPALTCVAAIPYRAITGQISARLSRYNENTRRKKINTGAPV